AGSFLSKLLSDNGAKIGGPPDASGPLHDPDGLHIDDRLDRRDRCGMVTNRVDAVLSHHELFEIGCATLIPAAITNQITEEDADDIKADIIGEAANGPTTKEATKILTDNGKLIVPDVLASAGGVTVSYFEWVQNNQGYYWDEDEVNEKLQLKLRKAFD